MSEPTQEQAELQLRIQATMHIMIQSMLDMVWDRFEKDVEELFEDSEFDLVMGTCFIKTAVDLVLYNDMSKDSFMSMCSQLFDVVEFHNSDTFGNA